VGEVHRASEKERLFEHILPVSWMVSLSENEAGKVDGMLFRSFSWASSTLMGDTSMEMVGDLWILRREVMQMQWETR
jgi:hypothetical protein